MACRCCLPWNVEGEIGQYGRQERLPNRRYLLQEEALQGNPVDRTSLELLRPESFSSILILADNTEYWQRLTDQVELHFVLQIMFERVLIYCTVLYIQMTSL